MADTDRGEFAKILNLFQVDPVNRMVTFIDPEIQRKYEIWANEFRMNRSIPVAVPLDHHSLRQAFIAEMRGESPYADITKKIDEVSSNIKSKTSQGPGRVLYASPAQMADLEDDSKKTGVRLNTGKAPIGMILEAKHALEGCAEVMAFGAKKYSRSNWRKGLSHTQIADSLSRHLIAWLSGEDLDPESGLPHLNHLLCNAIFLAENSATRPDLDDRPFKDGQFTPATDVIGSLK